jgi:CRISPR-associated protein Cmr4
MTEYLLYLYAESPVHAGAANSLDVLDLPIQREAVTGYPVIWGQSLKGALRQAAVDASWDAGTIASVFGSPIGAGGSSEESRPGNVNIGDAQLVAMPVPTLRRTFAWVTSEIALGRLGRKYRTLGHSDLDVPAVAGDRAVALDAVWAGKRGEVLGPCVVPIDHDADGPLAGWAQRIADDVLPGGAMFTPFAAKLRQDLLLVGTDLIGTLLRECTEQTVRVQLKADSKTVEEGPFYSEYLPAETILAASLTQRHVGRDADEVEVEADDLEKLLSNTLIQIGGDETLGKGLMWASLVKAP